MGWVRVRCTGDVGEAVVVSEHEQDVGLGGRVAPELCGGGTLIPHRRAVALAEHRKADGVGLAPLVGDAGLGMVVAG